MISNYALGRYDAAEFDASALIRINPKIPHAYLYRGMVLAAKDQREHILKNYNQAIHLDPNFTEAYRQRGHYFYYKRQYKEAIKDFSQAISLTPGETGNYYNRGRAYYDLDRFDEAIADFSVVIASNPKDYETLTMRGESFFSILNFQAAMQDANAALAVQPDYLLAHLTRARTYSAIGEFEKSISLTEEVFRLAQENSFYKAQARAIQGAGHYKLGHVDKALVTLNESIKIDPRMSESRNLRSKFLMEGERFEEALEDFNVLVKSSPDNPLHLADRSLCYAAMGQFENALIDSNRVLKLAPDKPEFWFAHAGVHQHAGNSQATRDACKKAIGLNPNYALAYRVLALDQLIHPQPSDNVEETLALATKACELSDWKDFVCLDTLSATYSKKGDYITAHKWSLECQKLNPPQTAKSKAYFEETARKAAEQEREQRIR